ncbi:ABC transporter ATP-binding protein [Candidatus Cloacimonadaceae bacterium]
MIDVKGLSVNLGGKSILQNISFSLAKHENLVILGRSGCGKTVLIKTLLGIYRPCSGEVWINGIDLYDCSLDQDKQLRQRIAMVFQNAALLDSFSVRQNVALPLYERGEKDCEAIRKKVEESLAKVGLEHTLDLLPAQLSGGMRKRVGIARALVYDPEYLIFDEPVSGLDPITAQEVMFYIAQIAKTANATLITITHDLRNLSEICQKVLFLDGGKQLFFGELADFVDSNDSFIRRYLQ